MKKHGSVNLAVLIDSENTSPRQLDFILGEIATSGNTIGFIRAYADFSNPCVKAWLKVTEEYGIERKNQPTYNKRKNSTDMALAIDAMKIKEKNKEITGFCFVTSDVDFTILAEEFRNDNFYVMGVGKHNTSRYFINTCQEFIYTDTPKKYKFKITKRIEALINSAFERCVNQVTGMAPLSNLGHALRKIDPAFEVKGLPGGSLSRFFEVAATPYIIAKVNQQGVFLRRRSEFTI